MVEYLAAMLVVSMVVSTVDYLVVSMVDQLAVQLDSLMVHRTVPRLSTMSPCGYDDYRCQQYTYFLFCNV
jgi:hypothetical protein